MNLATIAAAVGGTAVCASEFPKLAFRKLDNGRWQGFLQETAKTNPITSVAASNAESLFAWAYIVLSAHKLLAKFGVSEPSANVKKAFALEDKMKPVPKPLQAEMQDYLSSNFGRYVETSVHAGSEKVLSKETIQKLDAYFDSNFRKVSASECRAYVTSRVELIFTPSDKKDFKVSVFTAGGQYGKDKIYALAKSKHANTTDLSAITKAADLFDEALIKFARI